MTPIKDDRKTKEGKFAQSTPRQKPKYYLKYKLYDII